MDRRTFLEIPGKAALWLGAGASGMGLVRGLAAAVPGPDIAIVKGDPSAATRAAVEMLGGMASVVKPGARVIIKPNMSFASPPEGGANTHPMVVQTLAAMCWEAGAASVLILDHTLRSGRVTLKRSGIADAVSQIKEGTVFAINDSDLYHEVRIDGAETLKTTEVVKSVLDADVLIAAPTAKSHSGAGVSLSMKGMMGLVYDRGVMHWKGLDSCIVDMCTVIKADLSVVDAQYVLSTGGPSGPGKVLHERKVIASRDMVAADAQTVAEFTWYGRKFAPRQVGHIRSAHARGLGRMDIENQRVERLDL
jgi:uncharacterized protein (DUF362 family)